MKHKTAIKVAQDNRIEYRKSNFFESKSKNRLNSSRLPNKNVGGCPTFSLMVIGNINCKLI